MLLLNGGYNYDSTSIRPRYHRSTIYVTIIRLTMCAGCCSAAQINIYRLAWLLLADYVSVNLMTFDKQWNGRRIVLAIVFGLLLLCCRRSSLKSIENEQSKIISTSARLSVTFLALCIYIVKLLITRQGNQHGSSLAQTSLQNSVGKTINGGVKHLGYRENVRF